MATWDDLKSFLKIYEQAEIIEDNGNEYGINFEFDEERSQVVWLYKEDNPMFIDVLGHYVRVTSAMAGLEDENDSLLTKILMDRLPISKGFPIGKFSHFQGMIILTDAIPIEYTPLEKIA